MIAADRRTAALAAALLLAAAPGRAACVDPRALLAQMREASGGAAWDGVKALHTRAHLVVGGAAGDEDIYEDVAAGRYLREAAMPTGAQADGFDGVSLWTRPPTEPPYVFGDADTRLGAADESFRTARAWWFPERHDFTAECAGERNEDGHAFDLVRITPEGGRPFVLWIDRASHLVARDTEQQAEQVSVTDYADFRSVGGLTLPFTIRNTGETTTDTTETIEAIDINPLIADARFLIPPADPLAGPASVTVPFRLENGKVLVAVRVNGQAPFPAEFDTGGDLLLPPDLVKELGVATAGATKATGGGEGSLPSTEGIVRSISIGGAMIDNAHFDSFAWGASGSRRLLVGREVLQRWAVRLDFDAMTMTLTRPGDFDYRGSGAIIPFHFQDNEPEVLGAVDGMAGVFTVDTGANGSLLLLAPFARRHDLVARYHAVIPYGGSSVGATYGVYGRAGEVSLFGADGREAVTVSRPITRLSLQKGGYDADRYVSGNIEIGILQQFNVTFDYARRRIIFEPNRHYGQPDIFDRSGLRLETAGGGWRVAAVWDAGPAHDAGVRPGETVTAIDGRPAAGLDRAAIKALMTAPVGTRVQLSLGEGGQAREVVIVLRDVL